MSNLLRPSGSKRWLLCPGSVWLSQRAEAPEATVDGLRAAVQGTVCHELLERCITDSIVPETQLGKVIHVEAQDDMVFDAQWPVDKDMINACNMFLDYIYEKRQNCACFSELSMVHSTVVGLGGTADCVLYDVVTRTGEIVDLKYGTGSVSAEKRDGTKNPQLMCYAALVFDKFPDLESLGLTIVQPRRKTKKKILSTTVTRAESDEFLERVDYVEKLQETIDEDNIAKYLVEGDCYYCPARQICPLRRDREIKEAFTVLE